MRVRPKRWTSFSSVLTTFVPTSDSMQVLSLSKSFNAVDCHKYGGFTIERNPWSLINLFRRPVPQPWPMSRNSPISTGALHVTLWCARKETNAHSLFQISLKLQEQKCKKQTNAKTLRDVSNICWSKPTSLNILFFMKIEEPNIHHASKIRGEWGGVCESSHGHS